MNTSKIKLLSAMGVFGTIGIFVKFIPLSSAAIAMTRGVIGVAFLALIMALTKKPPQWAAIRRNLLLLIISGSAIGFNWVALFESYKYTTVATATACYYLAPLFLLLASPLLGEKLTFKKLACILTALVGMVLVSGITDGPHPGSWDLTGVLLATGAAALYATVMFLNKKMSPIGAYDKTILQLGSAAVVIIPYLLFTEGFTLPQMTGLQWLLLGLVGVVHTGISYALYFDSLKQLPTQTVALFSYLDPVIAILLSALLLKEPMTLTGIIGTVLILGSALYSELSPQH